MDKELGGGGKGWVGESQGGCERRIEVLVTVQKKNRGGGGSGWMWTKNCSSCENKKKSGGGSDCRGVRVDVDKELKFLVVVKIKKKWGGGEWSGWVGLGVRVDVNEELKFS